MSDELYSGTEYFDKHPDWHVGEADWKAKNILRILNSNALSPASVCEIGCGAGEILNVLHSKMPSSVNFEGYEIAPKAFELTKSREKERLKFHLAGLDAVPDGKTFDLLLMIDVFEHVEDFYGFLSAAKAKAKHFVFHIPLDLSVQSVLRAKPLSRKRKNVGHIHYFTKETALASLEHCGYKVDDWFYTGSYTDLPVKSMRSRISKLPRKLMYSLNKDYAARMLGGFSIMVLAR